MIKVVKFGGSSVANAEQFRKVKQIVASDPSRLFVVSSACGKESSEDHKVTDLLYLCEAHIRYGVSYEPIFQQIEEKYYRIRDDLGLTTDLSKAFQQIRAVMKKGINVDYLVSRGEYLTSLLLAEYLGFEFVDAADVITFRYNGDIDMERTEAQLKARSSGKGMVMPGFYGAMPNGTVKVMSRGGSDITGSVIANIVNADVYENWTDVSGILVADPRIIKNPKRIPCINYSELREMSYLGANVLHDDAVFPVKLKNIPINIRNTNDPDNPGTMILDDCSEADRQNPPFAVTGITGRKDFTVLTLVKSHTQQEVGFIRRLLSVFEDYHISVETILNTVDTYSMIIQTEAVNSCLYEIIGNLKDMIHPDDLKVDEHMALVAVVGRAMPKQPGMSGKLLSEFGQNDINIKVISQTADELSILVGVDNRDFEKAIQCIYEKFIAEENSK